MNVAYGQSFTLPIVIAMFYSADNIAFIVITDGLFLVSERRTRAFGRLHILSSFREVVRGNHPRIRPPIAIPGVDLKPA